MKATFDDHVITTRPVHTETGRLAPQGTHGFILRVRAGPEERYVAELWLPNPPDSDEDESAFSCLSDFEVV
jgi:hypothetical protein